MRDLRINERFKDACPSLSEDEFERLESLIVKDGVIFNPILIWNDVIVDGHNRYNIAKKHKIEFTTNEISFESDEEAIFWIKENAISQRNLNDYQRSVLVLELEDYYKGKAKERKVARLKKGNEIPDVEILPPRKNNGKVRDQLAKKAGISGRTLDKVKYIDNNAREEIKEQVENGEISINKAFNETKIPKSIVNPDVDTLERAASSLDRWFNTFKDSPCLYEFTETISDLVEKIRDKKATYGKTEKL
jgi:hypothetical protein